MKTFAILILILIVGCQSKNKDDITNKSTEPILRSETLSSNDKIDFSGIWMSELYLNDITKNKKPREAQTLTNLSFVEFPDSIGAEVLLIWNFHEGTSNKLTKTNEQYYIGETPIEVNDKKIVYDGVTLIRTKIKDRNQILEELIFQGRYSMNGKEVVLQSDGQIRGLDNFTYYQPIQDYFDPAMDVNQIVLKNELQERKAFGFEFKLDSLLIYELNCIDLDTASNTCYVVEFGNIKYLMKLLE